MKDLLPRSIVMDFQDYSRAKREAHSVNANPYDYIYWDTLQGYENLGMLITRIPEYQQRQRSNYTQFDYSHFVPPKKRSEFYATAKRITSKLHSTQLDAIARAGFTSWKRFGLELKAKFKEGDTVFSEAIGRTQHEIDRIESGAMPVDSEKLLIRYFMKLQTGLAIADLYSEKTGLPTRVFDTPEYSQAAKLLADHLSISSTRFAIPSQGPDKNEELVMELLHLSEPITPLVLKDFELLLKAVEYLKDRLDNDPKPDAVRYEFLRQYDDAVRRVKQRDIVSFTVGGTPLLPLVHALMENPESSLFPLIIALATTVVAFSVGEEILRGPLQDYDPSVQFAVVRSVFYNKNPIFRFKRETIEHLLRLARTFRGRPHTEERVARQMMEPWLDRPVWYEKTRKVN